MTYRPVANMVDRRRPESVRSLRVRAPRSPIVGLRKAPATAATERISEKARWLDGEVRGWAASRTI